MFPAVRSMTILDLRRLQSTIDPAKEGVSPLPAFGFPSGNLHAVIVNVGESDATLRKAFTQWLAQISANAPARTQPKRERKLNTRHWGYLGILPYLDLKIWGIETGRSISRRVMANALGLDEDTVKKRTEPLALQLMARGSWRTRWSLSKLEAAASESRAKS
jgi:hypothetical protein